MLLQAPSGQPAAPAPTPKFHPTPAPSFNPNPTSPSVGGGEGREVQIAQTGSPGAPRSSLPPGNPYSSGVTERRDLLPPGFERGLGGEALTKVSADSDAYHGHFNASQSYFICGVQCCFC